MTKTAIVHEWLTGYAGAERVLEEILKLYPDADIFSLVDFIPEGKRGFLMNKKVKTSFIQRLPMAQKKYRSYLPFFPTAAESFDLSGYDLVISIAHCVAKGVRTGPGQKHLCLCCTPVRYAWDLRGQYLREAGLDKGIKGIAANRILDYVKDWDLKTAGRPDAIASISEYVRERVKRIWGRDSDIVYPPVDTEYYSPDGSPRGDFYLAASRMVPYKRIDMLAKSFSLMPDKKLVIIGDGPDYEKVKAAAGPNVTLLGYKGNEVLRDHMRRAKAFLFAAEEDFGIMPLEAQACGTPVIAFGKGGSLETIKGFMPGSAPVAESTGVFFPEQTPEAVAAAVSAFEGLNVTADACRANALRFSEENFRRSFSDFVKRNTAA